MVLTIIISLVTGVLASLVSFFALRAIRPRIKVSDKIAKQVSDNNEKTYQIKFVNLSKSVLKNLKYELSIGHAAYQQERRHKGKVENFWIYSFNEIPFAKPPLDFVAKYDKNDKKAEWAIRLAISHDLEKELKKAQPCFLRFTFYAESGKTDASKMIVKEYLLSDIVKGRFKTGLSLEIE